nr:hypothetical protein [Mucilaginibacter sp. SP1R1]
MKHQPNKSNNLFARNTSEGRVSGQAYSYYLKRSHEAGFDQKFERTPPKNGYIKLKKK